MAVMLMIIGIMIWTFGANLYRSQKASSAETLGSGVVHLIIQLVGVAIFIYGILKLLS